MYYIEFHNTAFIFSHNDQRRTSEKQLCFRRKSASMFQKTKNAWIVTYGWASSATISRTLPGLLNT